MYYYDEDGNCFYKDENDRLQYCGNYLDHAQSHTQAALDAENRENRHWALSALSFTGTILWTLAKSAGYAVYAVLWVVFKFVGLILFDFLPFFLGGLLIGLGISQAFDD